jgi:hypothetical protein
MNQRSLRVGAQTIPRVIRGIAAAIRARPTVFVGVALGLFALNLFLPVIVLSLARKPVDYFTFNPWLSRLPEWLASSEVSLARKLKFLSELALAWFISDSAVEGVEWGFVVDVPSLTRFLFTSLLFGAYFALWFYRRDQVKYCGVGTKASRYGGAAGGLTSLLGFSAGPCSVMGCGAPVLPVVGLAVTGISSGTLTFFAELSRAAIAVVFVAMALAVAYFGWLVGAQPGVRPPARQGRSGVLEVGVSSARSSI